jgi:hypothetical protein
MVESVGGKIRVAHPFQEFLFDPEMLRGLNSKLDEPMFWQGTVGIGFKGLQQSPEQSVQFQVLLVQERNPNRQRTVSQDIQHGNTSRAWNINLFLGLLLLFFQVGVGILSHPWGYRKMVHASFRLPSVSTGHPCGFPQVKAPPLHGWTRP